LVEEPIKTDKKFVFAIADKGKTFIFSCTSEEERAEWVSLLRLNKGKDPQPPPTNGTPERKGLKYSFETNVASTMLGRKIIKENLPAEAYQVLDALCSFIEQVKGPQTAQAFKKAFLKFGSKIGLLHYNKFISDEEAFNWRKRFLKFGSIVVDFYQMPSIFDCQVITKQLNDMKKFVAYFSHTF
jgi:Domain of unknown function (DUF758)